jgi:hypothetical protein
MPKEEQRELIRAFAGAGLNEAERALVRRLLRLSTRDVPVKPFLGFPL